MKSTLLVLACLSLIMGSPRATASQATDTSIVISGQNAGATPFIAKLTLTASDLTTLKRIRFTIEPKLGAVARPVSATYSQRYLLSRGYVDSQTKQLVVPVFGLYAGYNNTVALTYVFHDGSSEGAVTNVATQPFDDACHYGSPTVHLPRTAAPLSYDYMLVATSCSTNSPAVIDTDGALRWVGTGDAQKSVATFYRNRVYLSSDNLSRGLLRLELDGEVKTIATANSLDIVGLHHSIDRGKYGLILDVNTEEWVASVNIEIDETGNVLKKWSLGDIIRDAMIAGGDDPSVFVRNANGQYNFFAYEDWFHNNAVSYRKSDDSLIISSRENFVICVDYDTGAIKWILGDETKQWYRYPSLRKYALRRIPGTRAPFGQHAVSITKDDHLLLFDNGEQSEHHRPLGYNRSYSAPRKYQLDLVAKTAREVWSFDNNQSIRSPFRSSVYEDAPSTYLVHYSNAPQLPRIIGLTAAGEKAFDYSYPGKAFRSLPVHWERLMFIEPVNAGSAATALADDGSDEED